MIGNSFCPLAHGPAHRLTINSTLLAEVDRLKHTMRIVLNMTRTAHEHGTHQQHNELSNE